MHQRSFPHLYPTEDPSSFDPQYPVSPFSFRAALAFLALFLLSLYLLIYGGRFHIIDEVSIYAMAENLAKRGSLDTDQILWSQWVRAAREVQGAFGREGHVFSKKGFGAALLPAFLIRLALDHPTLGLTFVAFLTNPLFTALTAVMLALYVRRLGFKAPTALVLALVYGTATLALPYTRMLFGEPVAALGTVTALYALHRSESEPSWSWAAAAGFALSLSIWARLINSPAVLFLLWYQYAHLRRVHPRISLKDALRTPRVLAFLVTTALVGVGGYALYNAYRYGVPWQTGYQITRGEFFTTPPWIGFYGLTLSPLRGLVWYTPVFALSLFGFRRLWHARPLDARLLVSVIAVYFALFSTWWMWWGGFAWGPRFLLPIIPLLVVALAPLWEDARWRRWVLAFTVISLVVQALAVLPDFALSETLLETTYGSVVDSPAMYDLRWSPIVLQARLLAQGFWDVAWVKVGPSALPTVGISVGLMLVTATGMWWVSREGARDLLSKARLVFVLGILLLVGMWAAATTWGMRAVSNHALRDPFEAAMHDALHEVRVQSTPGDVLVTLAPFDYTSIMNWAHTPIYTLGLAPHPEPLRPEEEHLLDQAARAAQGHIWLLAARIPPAHPEALAERWLSERAFLVSNRWFGDLRLVDFAPPGDMSARVVEIPRRGEARVWPGRVLFYDWPGRLGKGFRVEVQWQVFAPVDGNMVAFVHLLTSDGRYVAGTDAAPVNGYRPTFTWRPGEVIADRKAFPLPADIPPGTYVLEIGLYDPGTGERVQLGERTEVILEGVVVSSSQ